MATHSSILPGESHGQRSLEGYSPWGCKESDSTERLTRVIKLHHVSMMEDSRGCQSSTDGLLMPTVHQVLLLLSRFSRVRLFATSWTVALQAPLSMGFSRKKYWSGLPFLSPEDLSNPGTEPRFPALEADSLPFELQGSPSLEND